MNNKLKGFSVIIVILVVALIFGLVGTSVVLLSPDLSPISSCKMGIPLNENGKRILTPGSDGKSCTTCFTICNGNACSGPCTQIDCGESREVCGKKVFCECRASKIVDGSKYCKSDSDCKFVKETGTCWSREPSGFGSFVNSGCSCVKNICEYEHKALIEEALTDACNTHSDEIACEKSLTEHQNLFYNCDNVIDPESRSACHRQYADEIAQLASDPYLCRSYSCIIDYARQIPDYTLCKFYATAGGLADYNCLGDAFTEVFLGNDFGSINQPLGLKYGEYSLNYCKNLAGYYKDVCLVSLWLRVSKYGIPVSFDHGDLCQLLSNEKYEYPEKVSVVYKGCSL